MRAAAWFNRLREQAAQIYDKLLALAVLVVLCVSVLYLAYRVGSIDDLYEDFISDIMSVKPEYPDADPVNPARYEDAVERLSRPPRIEGWTNAMFVPEARVWCVDCRMPIPYQDRVCPFCKANQPPPREANPLFDRDGDGIPDLWERKFGLDPADPDDVFKDNDGDQFINLVEFRAEPQTDLKDLSLKHGTDMNDPNDFPPPEDLLFVKDIRGTPFELVFLGRIKLPDDTLKFQLNLRNNARTIWAKLGEPVEGFVLKDYREKIVRKRQRGVLLNVDESVLVLERGGKTIELQHRVVVPYSEYKATLVFQLDGTTYEVEQGQTFALKGRAFRVNAVDSQTGTVVVVRLSDGRRIGIRREPVRGGAAPEASGTGLPAS